MADISYPGDFMSKIVFIGFIFLTAVLLTGCIKTPSSPDNQTLGNQTAIDLKARCCTECKAAFSQSPVGVGPQAATCGTFTTGKPMSEQCKAYFENNSMTVSQCGYPPP